MAFVVEVCVCFTRQSLYKCMFASTINRFTRACLLQWSMTLQVHVCLCMLASEVNHFTRACVFQWLTDLQVHVSI